MSSGSEVSGDEIVGSAAGGASAVVEAVALGKGCWVAPGAKLAWDVQLVVKRSPIKRTIRFCMGLIQIDGRIDCGLVTGYGFSGAPAPAWMELEARPFKVSDD